jgi:hypothetical protein
MPKGLPEIRREEPFNREKSIYKREYYIKIHVPYIIISKDGETHTMTILKKESYRPHYNNVKVKRNMFTPINKILGNATERPTIYIALVDENPEELPVTYTFMRDEFIVVVTYRGKQYRIIDEMEGGKRKKTRRFKRSRRSYSARLKK